MVVLDETLGIFCQLATCIVLLSIVWCLALASLLETDAALKDPVIGEDAMAILDSSQLRNS
jgi:hypothetical protein